MACAVWLSDSATEMLWQSGQRNRAASASARSRGAGRPWARPATTTATSTTRTTTGSQRRAAATGSGRPPVRVGGRRAPASPEGRRRLGTGRLRRDRWQLGADGVVPAPPHPTACQRPQPAGDGDQPTGPQQPHERVAEDLQLHTPRLQGGQAHVHVLGGPGPHRRSTDRLHLPRVLVEARLQHGDRPAASVTCWRAPSAPVTAIATATRATPTWANWPPQ